MMAWTLLLTDRRTIGLVWALSRHSRPSRARWTQRPSNAQVPVHVHWTAIPEQEGA